MDRPESKAIAWRVSSPSREETLFSIRTDGGWRRIQQLLDSPHMAHKPTLEHRTRTRECIGSSTPEFAAGFLWQSGEEQRARPIHASSCTPSSLQEAVRHRSDPQRPRCRVHVWEWGGAALSPPHNVMLRLSHSTRPQGTYGRRRATAVDGRRRVPRSSPAERSIATELFFFCSSTFVQ